jgi:hypothetical protein
MKKEEKIAVFMDYSQARFIICNGGVAHFSDTLESGWESHPRERGEGSDHARFGSNPYQGSNNEYSKNMQEQQYTKDYYRQVKERLSPYNEILLFGGGQAKKEMHHFLLKQNAFKGKTIYVETSDYLTDNQLLETVSNYFLRK